MQGRFVSFFALLWSLASLPAFAQQVTGTIFGRVQDSSGAAIATANVKLVSSTTGAHRQALTDDTGNFVLASLDPGSTLPFRLLGSKHSSGTKQS